MQLSYSIQEVSDLVGIGRTRIYAAIKSGDLVAKKFGKRTLILKQDVETFLNNLEPLSKKKEASNE